MLFSFFLPPSLKADVNYLPPSARILLPELPPAKVYLIGTNFGSVYSSVTSS